MTDLKKALEGRTIKEVKYCHGTLFEVLLDDGMEFSVEPEGDGYYKPTRLYFDLAKSRELIEGEQ